MGSMRIALLSVLVVGSVALVGCGLDATDETSEAPPTANLEGAPIADGDPANDPDGPGATSNAGTVGASDPGAPGVDNPGAKPTAACTVTKDGSGFFTRNSGKSNYVAYVPSSYDGSKPMRLVVGIHGCGDTAYNFATWGVAPYQTRTTQTHIAISVDGASGGGSCWSIPGDADKVTAAIDDIKKCFWVHQKKVVLAGYSSGGQLSYRMGLDHADRYAGILIENSGLYAAGTPSATLLANATWKINIAHRAHTSDSVFPIATVKSDWSKTMAAGFPIVTSETAGTHDGTSADWATWLLPQSAGWIAP